MVEHLGSDSSVPGPVVRLNFLGEKTTTEGLSQAWVGTYADFLDKLDAAYTEEEFISILRSTNILGGIAGERQLKNWRKKWFALKTQALIKAARQSREAQFLDLTVGRDTRFPDEPRLRFGLKRSEDYYNTTENIHALFKLVGEEEYLALFGNIRGACVEDIRLPMLADGVKPEISIGAKSRYCEMERRFDMQTQHGVFAAFEEATTGINKLQRRGQSEGEIASLWEVRCVLLVNAAALRRGGVRDISIGRTELGVGGKSGDSILCAFENNGRNRFYKIELEKFARVCAGEGNMTKLLEPYDEMDEHALGRYRRSIGKTHRGGVKEREKRLRGTSAN